MAAKTLIRRGSSMAARFLNSTTPPLFPTYSHKTLISPSNLFPLSNLPHQFPFSHQYDAVSPTSLPYGQIKDVELVNDFYPFGHPSLDFFLPSANDSNSEGDPMILFPKRPFQPSTLRRKRVHGFFARKATKGGRRVIARRVAKGRHRITA